MLHPDTELRAVDERIGYGVFATRRIPRGTIIWTLDALDQVLAPPRVEALGERYAGVLERFTWINGRGERILCWDFSRFMNHSCEANVLAPGGLDLEIAVRDIEVGEELTSDYAALNLERPFECCCGRRECRGVITAEHFDDLRPRWDAAIREAFARIREVEQPLWPLLADPRTVEAAAADPRRVPSIVENRFP